MLVLARKVGEEIIIGGGVSVWMVAVAGDKVRLGVTAPRNIPVDRKEIHELRVAQRTGAKPPPVAVAT